MKVLHIINSVTGGGAERLLENWVAHPGKYDIDVLSLTKLSEEDQNNPHYFSTQSTSPYQLKNLWRLYKYIKDYDVIHVHLFPAQLFVAVWRKIFPKKIFITTEHSTSNRRRKYALLRWIDRWMYKQYVVVGCISKPVEESLQYWVPKAHSKVVFNGVPFSDIEKASPIDLTTMGLPKNAYILTMASRFTEAKDQLTVIRAMQRLPNNMYLLLLGDGELREQCELYVKKHQLIDRVKFLGFRTDLYSIFKASDVIIQSSLFEGFGLTLVEGLVCEKPVMITNVEGMRDLLEMPEFIFECGDDQKLAQLIMDWYHQKETMVHRLEKLKKDVNTFDFQKMVSLYEKIYEACMNKEKL